MDFMLTKEQIAKLPVEDQETLAAVELGRAQQRQLLLLQARGKGDWRSVFMAVYIIFMCCIIVFLLRRGDQNERQFAVYALLGLTIFNSLIQIQAARTNRRLDALVKLLDEDGKLQSDDKQSK
jgi:hypothetical protein